MFEKNVGEVIKRLTATRTRTVQCRNIRVNIHYIVPKQASKVHYRIINSVDQRLVLYLMRKNKVKPV